MNQTLNQVYWYEIYEKLSETLTAFNNVYAEESGRELYDRCKVSEEFIQENSWFNKFFMTSTLGQFVESCIAEIVDYYHRLFIASKDDTDLTELRIEYHKKKEKFEFVASRIADKPIQAIVFNHLDEITKIIGIKTENNLNIEIKQKEMELELLIKERDRLEQN